jgi:hypothetical protein
VERTGWASDAAVWEFAFGTRDGIVSAPRMPAVGTSADVSGRGSTAACRPSRCRAPSPGSARRGEALKDADQRAAG